jgi:CHAT domain-containing protein/Tfp pilus assembly protein PilF
MFRPKIKLYFALTFLLLLVQISQAQDNQIRLNAEKLQTEAEALFNKNTPADREQAALKFTEALKLWGELADVENQIKALNKLNDISYAGGDFKQCIIYSSTLLPLAVKIGNKNLEAGVLGNLGLYNHLIGESRKGLEFLDKSAALLGTLDEKQRQSVVLTNLGSINYDLGEIKTALDYLNQSLQLKREIKDRKGEGIVLNNLAYSYNEGGNKTKALEYYGKALEIAVEAKDQRTEATIFSNIGYVYHDLGELQKAFDYYQKSLVLRREIGDKYGEAVSLQNAASLYRTLGDLENSLNLINQSLEIYQKNSLKREEAGALSSIGALFSVRGDKEKALEYHQKALALQKTLEDKPGYAQVLRNIGKNYFQRNEFQKADEIFTETQKIFQEVNDVSYFAEGFNLLAQTAEKLGKTKEAEELFKKAVALQKEIGIETELADTLYFYAKFEEKNARRASALEKIQEAIKIIEDVRSSIISQNLRTSFLAEQQKYYDFYLELLMQEHKLQPSRGFDKVAFRVSESARARSLLDSLGESRSNIRIKTAPEILEEERILRQTINAKEYQRIEAVKSKLSEKAAQFEKEIAETFRQYQDLQTKIQQSNPQFASLVNPEPLSLAEFQKQVLDEETVLLEYFLGEKRSFLFFVSKNNLEIFELPSQDLIDTQVRQTLENLKSRAQLIEGETPSQRDARIKKADFNAEKNLAETSQSLLAPVVGKIQNKRLLIVSSGILQYLPFAALKIPNSKLQTPNSNNQSGIWNLESGMNYLIETNEIINLPSASVLPLLRETGKRKDSAKNRIAILADPVFSQNDARLKMLTAQNTGQNSVMRDSRIVAPMLRSDFSRLRFSRIEANAISELANENQRFLALDFAANLKSATSENLQKSAIIHFATHGFVNSQFPELSGIVLSLVDEKGNGQEGFLRLHDVYNLRLEANLVVLSACETALGKEIKGEGIVGLTRGFMFAGASTVAASLWRVDDRATADLMKKFYQRIMLEKMPPAAALRQAQISMLKEKSSAHPFYWAAFTLQGEWK